MRDGGVQKRECVFLPSFIRFVPFFFYSQFGFYKENEEVVEMRESPLYKNDSFGLRTLDESGRVTLMSFSGMNHFDWHLNASFVDDHIVPLLD